MQCRSDVGVNKKFLKTKRWGGGGGGVGLGERRGEKPEEVTQHHPSSGAGNKIFKPRKITKRLISFVFACLFVFPFFGNPFKKNF